LLGLYRKYLLGNVVKGCSVQNLDEIRRLLIAKSTEETAIQKAKD
jgi:hypothetical protein